jgi:predicted SnoaL-like aldol condensation-catalyzing enzyme
VADFVAEDYHQHSRHLPEGRAGLEGFVRSLFPDGPVAAPEVAALPPAILMGEGDLVVIAAAMPQPDGAGGEYLRLMYDGYRLRNGLIAEHWSGVDPRNPATH